MSDKTADIKLTHFAKAAGCSCKIPPAQLREILGEGITENLFPELLVGYAGSDDAAVYALDEQTALIATTDFFTPVVDEAYAFGKIAAANALSDVYAMGGRPLLALAVLGWPVDSLPAGLAKEVLDGGRAACAEAGIPLAGGHSIVSAEPFFGLCVNGVVLKNELKRNDSAEEGDLLFLTKPIGAGVLTTARKRGLLADEAYPQLLDHLCTLNRIGTKLGALPGIHSMTDVTGFGLLGHATEMALGSGLCAELEYAAIPVLEGARELAARQIVPDATYRNWNAYSATTALPSGPNMLEIFNLLSDPQTNGGLLIAARQSATLALQELFKTEGLDACTRPIGRFLPKGEQAVVVRNELS
ncbi:MAG: selenide, water dikinase SelD [Bacteroidetes bacterium]|nr:selenide, water dikinase SelD [Bacteroidota bacterium]MBS1630541.1 selenide, water dikinase SelD [Bacteroidota bacterium]